MSYGLRTLLTLIGLLIGMSIALAGCTLTIAPLATS